jgi:hypothetical protein
LSPTCGSADDGGGRPLTASFPRPLRPLW